MGFPFDRGNFAPQFPGCTEDVTKDGTFFDFCDYPLPAGGQLPVVMS
jgi:hypothetical protein